MNRPSFKPGRNIAMKVPADQFEATVAFYKETLGLTLIKEASAGSMVFDFGGKNLWIDRVPRLGQAEVWLEVETDDADGADRHLREAGVVRCDDVERLPSDFRGFWIKSPANVVHLLCEADQ